MRIAKAAYRDFRNIKSAELGLSPGINILCGGNAQGKTNLLEGISLFSIGKSFRPGSGEDLVRFEAAAARLTVDFHSRGRDIQATQTISREARTVITLGGVTLRSAAELVGCFPSVLFTPEHLSLIKSGPTERRRFLDAAISQQYGKYLQSLSAYRKVLRQKNALLKTLQKHGGDRSTLAVWNEKMAELSAYIVNMRLKYIAKLSVFAARAHNDISDETERLELRYLPAGSGPLELEQNVVGAMMNLTRMEDAEIRAGMSLVGPHRDDMDITVNGREARTFASQGQQRSCVLSLKMGEADLLYDELKEQPVLLLDDVLSELDEKRQEYVRERINGRQVIITCCDTAPTMSGKVFRVEAGCVASD